jgi:hypothetical protein
MTIQENEKNNNFMYDLLLHSYNEDVSFNIANNYKINKLE